MLGHLNMEFDSQKSQRNSSSKVAIKTIIWSACIWAAFICREFEDLIVYYNCTVKVIKDYFTHKNEFNLLDIWVLNTIIVIGLIGLLKIQLWKIVAILFEVFLDDAQYGTKSFNLDGENIFSIGLITLFYNTVMYSTVLLAQEYRCVH